MTRLPVPMRHWLAALAPLLLLMACAGPQGPSTSGAGATPPSQGKAVEPQPAAVAASGAAGMVLGRNDRLLIYRPSIGDRLPAIAERFLGKASLDWMIAEANGHARVEPGMPLVVPLKSLNPTGVSADRVQTIPILCYHRFGTSNSKMVISPTRFAAQLEWLARNGYRVIPLADMAEFLAGRKALPQKSVVITIDDGYESVYKLAYPLLKQHGFPATVFVYTDFLGAGDALRWPQIQEMAGSGLIDVQSHSKSHRNLIERTAGETEERYRANLTAEMQVPRDILQRRLEGRQINAIAYPFGDANAAVMEAATRGGFEIGATVVPGGNPFYAQPLLLRRTMIFGDLDIEGFKAKLQVSRALPAS